MADLPIYNESSFYFPGHTLTARDRSRSFIQPPPIPAKSLARMDTTKKKGANPFGDLPNPLRSNPIENNDMGTTTMTKGNAEEDYQVTTTAGKVLAGRVRVVADRDRVSGETNHGEEDAGEGGVGRALVSIDGTKVAGGVETTHGFASPFTTGYQADDEGVITQASTPTSTPGIYSIEENIRAVSDRFKMIEINTVEPANPFGIVQREESIKLRNLNPAVRKKYVDVYGDPQLSQEPMLEWPKYEGFEHCVSPEAEKLYKDAQAVIEHYVHKELYTRLPGQGEGKVIGYGNGQFKEYFFPGMSLRDTMFLISCSDAVNDPERDALNHYGRVFAIAIGASRNGVYIDQKIIIATGLAGLVEDLKEIFNRPHEEYKVLERSFGSSSPAKSNHHRKKSYVFEDFRVIDRARKAAERLEIREKDVPSPAEYYNRIGHGDGMVGKENE